MRRGRPFTLWLSILADLWKLVLLTACVLVTVIAFAAAVKPLADGTLGPVECLKFMGLALVPMLQYALPFAACFGATLAYYRLSADNEATAGYAGGISHGALLAPAVFTGLVLGALLLFLSNQAIPSFLRAMADLVTKDATKLLEATINRGEAFKFDDVLLHADVARAVPPEPESGAFQKLWLRGVLMVKLDARGDVAAQVTAQEAVVWLRRGAADDGAARPLAPRAADQSLTEVLIRPIRFVIKSADGAAGEQRDMLYAFAVPNTFKDDPKFLTFGQLRELRREPSLLAPVRQRSRRLAAAIARRDTIEVIRATLRKAGEVEFADPLSGRLLTLGARDLRPANPARTGGYDWRIVSLPGQPVTMDRRADPTTPEATPAPRQQAAVGLLRIVDESAPAGLGSLGAPARPSPAAVEVKLLDVSASIAAADDPVLDLGPAAAGAVAEWRFGGLRLRDDPAESLYEQSTAGLLAAAEARIAERPADAAALSAATGDLRRRIDDLLREALSKQHERLAMSVACLVMVLTGAVMALRLRDSLPLTVYLWAFFPALGAVLSISAGQQLSHGLGVGGLPLLWGGVAGLAGYTLFQFRTLARN